MPFFNRAKLVEYTINSILSNGFKDWELLAIDDGSDKDSVAYLKNQISDSRITFIKRNRLPKGAQTCRNIGLSMAKGEYVVFFDSDDYVAPYCFAQRIKTLEANPEQDFMVFPSGTFINNRFIKTVSDNVYGYPIMKDDIGAFASMQLPFVVCNNIYRTEKLRNNHISWDESLLSLQDSDFNLQAILSGMNYKYAENAEPDYGYRIEERGQSISKKITSDLHKRSHLYRLEKNISTIQALYSHQYDTKLHQGILSIYNSVMSNGIDLAFSAQLLNIEKKYGIKQHIIFSIQIWLTKMISIIISAKRARQIVMLPFLIMEIVHRKQKARRISNLKRNILLPRH